MYYIKGRRALRLNLIGQLKTHAAFMIDKTRVYGIAEYQSTSPKNGLFIVGTSAKVRSPYQKNEYENAVHQVISGLALQFDNFCGNLTYPGIRLEKKYNEYSLTHYFTDGKNTTCIITGNFGVVTAIGAATVDDTDPFYEPTGQAYAFQRALTSDVSKNRYNYYQFMELTKAADVVYKYLKETYK